MKNYRIIFIFIFFLFFDLAFISAQEIEKSSKTEFIGQKYYYIHTLKQGQTIYSIAKVYAVDLDQIYEANPELKNSVQAGVVVKVPIIKNPESISFINHTVEKGETLYKIASNYSLKTTDINAINQGLTDYIKPGQHIKIPLLVKKVPENLSTTIHIVQKGETLYGIANQYGTNVAELKKMNPALTDNLQLGQQLKVPKVNIIETIEKKENTITFECGITDKQETYNIAVMIPFYLDHSYEIDTGEFNILSDAYRSFTFIQFYEGVQLALDSIKKTGYSSIVHVYDVADDTSIIESLLKKPEFTSMNLIIGPLFSNSFTVVSKWASTNKVNIVNPFTNRSDILSGNPFSFKILPSLQSEANQIVDFINNNYPVSNILIVYNDKESSYSDTLENSIQKIRFQKNPKIQYSKINYSKEGFLGVNKNLSDSKINIVITLIDGEAFVSNFLRNLNERAFENRIILFGRNSWEEYNNIEIEYLMNLNTHFYANSLINYNDTLLQSMVYKFRDKYKADPDYYGFQGYDIMMYFTQALREYGKKFQFCLQNFKPLLLCNNFDFVKTANGGYENTKGVVYRYENYKIINALINPIKEIKLLEKK